MDETTTSLVKISGLNVVQDGVEILHNVGLSVAVGEFVYFIGKVGSGKTSLLKVMYGELPFVDGTVEVVGERLYKLRAKRLHILRRKIGMIFQDFELMNDRSVNDNLRFVLQATDWKKRDIDFRINEVLTSVGMLTKKDVPAAKLSGGERQSVCIARALLNNPPLLLADEPTGNLDPDSSKHVMDILANLTRNGKAVIMVTHNYNIIKKYEGRIFMFDNKNVNEIDNDALEQLQM